METRIDQRSEEVQDIISQVPSWLLRWGISLVFLLFMALLATSWFIRYPDVIRASVVVTTHPSPINLVTRTSAKILLLKRQNQSVGKNEVIAVLQSNADYRAILKIETLLANNELNPSYQTLYGLLKQPLQAGDLQPFLNSSIKSLQELISFKKNALHEKQLYHLQKQIQYYNSLNQNLNKQLELMEQETKLSSMQFKSDSLLQTQHVIAPLEFNKARSSYLTQQRTLKTTEATILTNELQISALQKQLTELQLDKLAKEEQLETGVINTLNEFTSQLNKWKETFLFIAPSGGSLAYLGFIENDQFVESGKTLFSILPNSNKLIAKAELPVLGAGKVKTGQKVNIRISNYPYEQFGMLRGQVEEISIVPEMEKYSVLISLPNGMTSTYNKQLNFRPQLHGETEIITEDLRVLERIFYQMRKLLRTG